MCFPFRQPRRVGKVFQSHPLTRGQKQIKTRNNYSALPWMTVAEADTAEKHMHTIRNGHDRVHTRDRDAAEHCVCVVVFASIQVCER